MKTIHLSAFLIAATPTLVAAAADADGDGFVSAEEFSTAYPDVEPTMFVELDLDGDGMLNADELTRAVEMGTLPAESN